MAYSFVAQVSVTRILCVVLVFCCLFSAQHLQALPAGQSQPSSRNSTSIPASIVRKQIPSQTETIIKVPENQRRHPLGWFALPESLVVSGAVVFDNEKIRNALASHWEVVLCAHPQVDRREFATVVSKAALEGFYSSGYINAKVFATYSGNGLHLDIIEGDRAKRSRVKVKGAEKISPRLVQASLQAVTPEDNLSYDIAARNLLLNQVRDTYASSGYLFPKVSISVKPGITSTEALVIVSVDSEGPLCRLGTVKFTGLKDQKEDSLRSFVKFTEGEILTRERIKDITSLLYDSGRFIKVNVAPVKGAADEPTNLEVNLSEAKDCPPVDEELSLAQSSILKLGQWFNGFSASPKELLFNANIPGGMKIAGSMSPKKGILFNIDSKLKSSFRFLWTNEHLSAIDCLLKRCCTIPMTSGQVTVHLHVVPSGDEDSPFSAKASVTYLGERESDSPIVYETSFAPVAFLSFAGGCKILSCVKEEEKVLLKLSRKDNLIEMTIDSNTGCPLSIVVSKDKDGVEIFSLSATEGGFDVLESIHKRNTEKCEQTFAVANPFESGGTFVSETILERYFDDSPIVDGAKKFAVKCLVSPVLTGTDRIFSSYESKNKPSESSEDPVYSIPAGKKPQGMGAILLGPLAFISSADSLLSPLSWPRILSRGMLAYFAGRPQFASVWFGKLGNAKDIGPLGYFIIGKALSYVNGALAAKYYSRSLEVLSSTGFRMDIDFICSVKPLSSIARSMVLSISEIDKDTLQAFATTFVPEGSDTILQLFDKVLKIDKENSLKDILNSLTTPALEKEFKKIVKP